MSTIKYHILENQLSSPDKEAIPNLFLICGEPYLVKKALEKLCKHLLGKNDNQFALEQLDGTSTGVGDIIEQVSTFSFLVANKIIVVKDCPLFLTDKNPSQIRYNTSDIDLLTQFIQNGWPAEHTLIMTCAQSDKRKKIYKTIDKKALIIDCGVAKGARKADLDEQKSVLQSVAQQILNKDGKHLDNQAFHTLLNLTGFNLDLFVQNIEKLSVYSGDRKQITSQDIKTVVVREKKDPIFNFTNSVMGKESKAALFFLNSLFNDGFHPLQILKSLENLFRKLIFVSDFLHRTYPQGANLTNTSFNQFKQTILPKIVAQDTSTLKKNEEQELYLSGEKPKKKDLPSDLFLAPNPKNAYPVFQVFLKSENFSLDELCQVLLFLSDLDYNMKTSSIDAKTQIENLIIKLCSRGGFVYAQENKDNRHHF